jgi:hypothetical protein
MIKALIRLHDVNGLIARLESVLNERKQYATLLLVGVEERADMVCALASTAFVSIAPSPCSSLKVYPIAASKRRSSPQIR